MPDSNFGRLLGIFPTFEFICVYCRSSLALHERLSTLLKQKNLALRCDAKRSGARIAARGLKIAKQNRSKRDFLRSVSGPNDEAAVLCTREEEGSIWQREVRAKEAAETAPRDAVSTCLYRQLILVLKEMFNLSDASRCRLYS